MPTCEEGVGDIIVQEGHAHEEQVHPVDLPFEDEILAPKEWVQKNNCNLLSRMPFEKMMHIPSIEAVTASLV